MERRAAFGDGVEAHTARTRASEPKRRRRARGEGSIFKKTRTWKTKDGKTHSKVYWCVALSEGRVANKDGSSSRKRKLLYFTTASAAIEARNRYLTEANKPAPTEPERNPTTIAEYITHFLAEWQKRPTLQGKPHSPATIDSYRITLRQHVEPKIGGTAVTDLTSAAIQALYRTLETKVSRSMLARVHSALRVMLGLAVEEGVVPISPMAGIPKGKVPRHKRPHVEAFEPEQVAKLLNAAKDDRIGAIIQLAVDSGARQGELFALRWQDVDLEKAVIFIRRSVSETSAGLSIADVKTTGSRRNVNITRQTVAELKRRQKRADGEGFAARNDLIFPSERGYPLRKSNFLRETWNPIRKAAGMPNARFHSLRHTCATLLLRNGVHPKIVQERLGHASITLTLDTYSDSIPSLQQHAAEAMAVALRSLDRKGNRKRPQS